MLWKCLKVLLVSFFVLSCVNTLKTNRRTPAKPEQKDGEQKPLIPRESDKEKSPSEVPTKSGSDQSGVEIIPIKRGGPEQRALGKALYERHCVSCHPGLSGGDIKKFKLGCRVCEDLDSFMSFVPGAMPPNNIGVCDRECAKIIGFYLFP